MRDAAPPDRRPALLGIATARRAAARPYREALTFPRGSDWPISSGPPEPNVKGCALGVGDQSGRGSLPPAGSAESGVAIADSERPRGSARLSLGAVPALLKAWFADGSDHSLARRMAGTAFLIRVASAALVYLTQVVLARWMGGYEFGIYVYVWTWVLLVGGLVDFGLASSAQRFVPEYSGRKALDLLRGFLVGSRWL